jgi:hypothetical protein
VQAAEHIPHPERLQAAEDVANGGVDERSCRLPIVVLLLVPWGHDGSDNNAPTVSGCTGSRKK